MRLPVIDTTRTIQVIDASEVYGEDGEGGFLIAVRCPVEGPYTLPPFYTDRRTAEDAMREIFDL